MPATSPFNVTFSYPLPADTSAVGYKYTRDEFVSYFKKLAGSSKKFGLSFKENMGRDKKTLSSVTVVLSDEGNYDASTAIEVIAKNTPTLFPYVAKFERLTNVKSSLSIENVMEAFSDVTRHMYFWNRGHFKSLVDAEKEVVNHFKLLYNKSDDEVLFKSDMFKKICAFLIPPREKNEPPYTKEEYAKEQGKLLKRLGNDSLTQSEKNLLTKGIMNERGEVEKKPLLKLSQLSDLSKQASQHYIAYTPASGEDEAEYKFSAISKDHDKPGRMGKTTKNGKNHYVEYKLVSDGIYNRTKDTSNDDIIATVTSTAAKKTAAEADPTSFAAASRKPVEKVELTPEEKIRVTEFKNKYTGKFPMPKSEHGILKKMNELEKAGMKF